MSWIIDTKLTFTVNAAIKTLLFEALTPDS